MMKKLVFFGLLALCAFANTFAQTASRDTLILLKPDRIFDGHDIRTGVWVLIKGNHISEVGNSAGMKIPPEAKIIELKGATLMPGLIEGHSHLFLHPYNETLWDDQ